MINMYDHTNRENIKSDMSIQIKLIVESLPVIYKYRSDFLIIEEYVVVKQFGINKLRLETFDVQIDDFMDCST